MREVFVSLLEHMAEKKPCMLVSAVGGEGSAPRKIQSHMLVDESGRVCGTVGGGAVEGNSIAYAAELLGEKNSAVRLFELYEHAPHDIGMICGGKVNVHFLYVCPFDEVIRSAAYAAVSAYDSGCNAWLMLDLRRHLLTIFDGKTQAGAKVAAALLGRLGRLPLSVRWMKRFIIMSGLSMPIAYSYSAADMLHRRWFRCSLPLVLDASLSRIGKNSLGQSCFLRHRM